MLNAISLFSGCGGFDEGALRANIRVCVAVEYDEQAARTFTLNHPQTEMLNDDIRNISFECYRGGIDLVFGGPPCQPFSRNANGSLGQHDSRDMVPEFLRCVRQVGPKYFVMENVAALAGRRHRAYLDSVLAEMRDMGYAVSYRVMDASLFGSSQRRKRLIIVGRLSDYSMEIPPFSLKKARKVQELLDGVFPFSNEPVGPGPDVVYAKNPVVHRSAGGSLLVNGRGRPIGDLCNTITTSSGNGRHIVDPDGVLEQYHSELKSGGQVRSGVVPGVRRLTLDEAKRIQGFGPMYRWAGTVSSQWRQVGNAVPVELAHAVLEMIAEDYEDCRVCAGWGYTIGYQNGLRMMFDCTLCG